MDGRLIEIAVIDDGVNEGFFKTGKLNHNIEIAHDLEVVDRVGYDRFVSSHGSICAAIIKKYSPHSKISSIKILDKNSSKCAIEQLVKAIEWCIEKNIGLISLSLGTIYFKDFDMLNNILEVANSKDIIIVAACNNRNIFTYPASHNKVIGVKCDKRIVLEPTEYIYNVNAIDGIDITARGSHALVDYAGNEVTTPLCNSYAAPYITSIVYRLMKINPIIKLEDIKEELEKLAKNNSKISNEIKRIEKDSDISEIDIPIIMIADYIGTELTKLVESLENFFKDDGYNAVSVICPSSIINNDVLLAKYKIYDPDIIIIAINASSSSKEYLNGVSDEFEIDIRISIMEKLNKGFLETINPGFKENDIFIVRESSRFDNINLKFKLFYLNEINCVSELFAYLIFLYSDY